MITPKRAFINVVNTYIAAMEKMTDYDLEYWVADDIGGVAVFADFYFFSFDDIRLFVDHKREADDIFRWHECTAEHGAFMNYSTWIMGDFNKQTALKFKPKPETAIIKNGRKVGNSTRQIDQYIQDLFDGLPVIVKDHARGGNIKKNNEVLFGRLMSRLAREHNLDRLMDDRLIQIDTNNYELKLR